MNKDQYRTARKLIRCNGLYALRWMIGETFRTMTFLYIEQKIDNLADKERDKGHDPLYDYDAYKPEEDTAQFPEFLNRSRITCDV